MSIPDVVLATFGQAAAWLDTHEPLVRASAFAIVFVLMAAWEYRAPARPLLLARRVRWSHNLGLLALNTLLLRLLFPAAAVGVAVLAAERGWGLLHLVALPPALAIMVAVIALDWAIWLQHVITHAVPLLWRMHRVHHADPDCDLTTGARFHPLEILLSLLFKFVVIVLLGPPVTAVILFEMLLNASALFNHGNVQLPARVDACLRWFIVTPDMHRVHHSIEDDEIQTNFGFALPWWDRLFGTYRAQPRAGHQGMTLGLRGYRDPREVSVLPGLLALPFRASGSSAGGGRRDAAYDQAGGGASGRLARQNSATEQ